jgi:hypothetical protein
MHRLGRPTRLALPLLLCWALTFGVARAEGVSAYVEEDYTNASQRSTDQSGRTARNTTEEVSQHYRLMLDRTFLPYVRFDGFGLFEKVDDWLTSDGVPSRADVWRAGGSAHLRVGPPVLNADVGYDRRDESTGTSLTSARIHTVNELYSAHAGWRPADWPSLDLRLARNDSYDVDRRLSDFRSDDVLVSSEYSAFRQLRLGYSVDYNVGTDHLSSTVVTAVVNSARANYGDTFNAGRTSLTLNYQFNNRVSDTTTQGTGGLVAVQQLPSAGLSLVETFPAVPQTDTLVQNPALIDGNLTASASINLGFSVSLAGDNNLRDMGLQFADPNTTVNTFYVWVDRQLPAEISGLFSWAAYKSDDNVNWTQVNVVGQVVFSAFQNRFEITIDTTAARYLKVVTRPLAVGTTADRRFSDIFVTELQALNVVPAQSVRGSTSSTNHSVAGSFHHVLLPNPQLAYDFSGIVSGGSGGTSYTAQNSLSLERSFARILAFLARVTRQDTGQKPPGQDWIHSGLFQYSASLTARPLPTLSHAFTYSGQYAETRHGTTALNSATLVNRVQLYRGVDVLASLGYNYNFLETGAVARGPTVIGTLSVVPNRVVTLSSSYYLSSLTQTGGGLPDQISEDERVDGVVTVSPIAALYLSGSVTRVIKGAHPTTLATATGSFSPFPDGTFLLRSSYTETLDTAQDSKTSFGTVGVRWNLTPRTYLDFSYTLIQNRSNAGSNDTRSFNATFVLQL